MTLLTFDTCNTEASDDILRQAEWNDLRGLKSLTLHTTVRDQSASLYGHPYLLEETVEVDVNHVAAHHIK